MPHLNAVERSMPAPCADGDVRTPMRHPSRPALRYHGGKFRLAPWIMKFFPPHNVYTEAYGGAAGVLLQKPRSHGEVYNDLDGHIVAFFRCLREPNKRDELVQAITLTPYARAEFELAWEPAPEQDIVEQARRTVIRAQMGFGSGGATKGRVGLRIDTMRKYTTAQMNWAKYPSVLLQVAERFQAVLIENRPAIDVLEQHDSADTLHFIDPPYVPSTRVTDAAYAHEMSAADHGELLDMAQKLKGMIVLSGYPCALYEARLPGWRSFRTRARISSGRGTALRTEVVWLNPTCERALSGCAGDLFAQVT
ncbi:D12 class N6 adenine-specific DNA methyltransferase [Verminephrobacter eiseniae EF01-2]|uniref:D12 class N6 adenine-specific DNA methyltransferase n=2 Tax=Verminephrobacter eiseniae TaxID=364317 RepID=A1WPB0_VEREI|nr:D12 class N6 adenine-specific DNA methyltransferase [Verminephrobacter eiseniae EF01-2]